MAIAEQDREHFEMFLRGLRDPITEDDKRRQMENVYTLGRRRGFTEATGEALRALDTCYPTTPAPPDSEEAGQ